MRKWIKRVGIFLAVIIFLIAAFLLFLHTSWGKSVVRNQVEKYLRKQLQTTVSIGEIDYRLPNWIRLNDILILDRRNDTLLSGGNLYTRLNMLKLISQKVEIKAIELAKTRLHVSREPGDSTFNFQFIIDAFSSPDKERDTTSSAKPMQLSINHISIDDVLLTFKDKKEKHYYASYIGHLASSPGNLDLGKSIFQLKDLAISGTNLSLIDSSLNGIATVISIQVEALQLDETSVDIKRQSVEGQLLMLKNSAFNYSGWNKENSAKNDEIINQTATETNWKVKVDKISLSNNSFAYHNTAMPAKKGFDYNHIEAKHINFFSRENNYHGNSLISEVDSCSILINDELNLKGLSTHVNYSDSLLLIKDLAFFFNNSQLITRGELAWPIKPNSVASGGNFKCRIENSTISYADILNLQPDLKQSLPISIPESGKIMISGAIFGSLQNFSAQGLQLNTSNNDFQFAGNVTFQNSSSDLNYHAEISQLKVQKKLISPALLRKLENQQLQLPANLSMNGTIHGSSTEMFANLNLSSEYGQLKINGQAKNISQVNKLQYDVNLDASNFETGKWMSQDSLAGKFTGQIHVKGSGIQPDKMNAAGNLQVESLVINGYNYSNVSLEGSLANSAFTVKGNINDSNLVAVIDLHGNPGGNYPIINGNIIIDKADLNNLKLTTDSVIMASMVTLESNKTEAGIYTASVHIDSTRMFINGRKINVDSVSALVIAGMDSTHIKVLSPFAEAELTGNYNLDQLSVAFENLLYKVRLMKNPGPAITGDRRLSVSARINQHDLLSEFIPVLEFVQPMVITGEYKTGADSSLFLLAETPLLRYKRLFIDQLQVKAEDAEPAMQFAVSAERIYTETDSLLNPSITGRLEGDLLTVSARVEDVKEKEIYAVNASIKSTKESTTFKLLEDLTFNHNKWKVPPDNSVVLLRDGFIVNNFSLSHAGHLISIQSKDPQTISTIDIRIDSFDIGDLLALTSFNDTAIADGTLNVNISFEQPIQKFPVFAGSLGIKDLTINRLPVGDLQINSTTGQDSLKVSGNLSGKNQFDFGGSIHSVNGGMTAGARLQKLDMNLAKEFIKEFISRASGSITGYIQVEGSISDPRWNGNIYIDSTAFALVDLNTLYRIDKQEITFDHPDIKFNMFTVTDTAGNKLTVDGTIKIIDPTEYGLNLETQAKNFIALNAPKLPKSHIYGTAILDADAKIKGTSNNPIIEGNVFLHGKSSIHYVMSETSDYTKKGKDVVRFVDIDTIPLPGAEVAQSGTDTLLKKQTSKGIKYSMDLRVSKDAEFSIVIDPATNDELLIKGDAKLNAGVEEGGVLGLTGEYKLESGYYNMRTKFLKEKFLLAKGSTITFNGDPMNAIADVATEYEVETSTDGLLRPEQNESTSGSQRFPFLVVLTIKGPISKPDLAFDIKIKENAPGLNQSLKTEVEDQLAVLRSDVSAMNKQVFSLLVTSHFTYTQGEGSLTYFDADLAVKEGMSRFLTEGMNQVAGDLIKGVDIDFTMKNYKDEENLNTKTDFGVAVSKNMMNDRLKVTVGTNFTTGETNTDAYENTSNQYIPDFIAAYKLSKDGRYLVKAYRKNEYDTVVEGYFAETGVSFMIEMEYNRFKELFKRVKEPKKP